MRVYLASPYGFSASGFEYLRKVREIAGSWGVNLLDPWDVSSFDREWSLRTARDPNSATMWNSIRETAPVHNFEMVAQSDAVVAVLDGADVDSGVACEIGYAHAMGIPVIGYRSDFRPSGDSIHGTVNLQVEACLYGGICTNWDQVGWRLREMRAASAGRRASDAAQ